MSLRRGGRDGEAGPRAIVEPPSNAITQRIELRSGDDLPGFAAVVEDEDGNVVDLTGAVAWLIICDEHTGMPIENTQIQIINPAGGVVQHDWTGQLTGGWGPGNYQLWVVAEWPNGDRLTAPSARALELLIRPAVDV